MNTETQIRTPKQTAELLKSHARIGKGLILDRATVIPPDELLQFLWAMGYSERED
ncbi:MAG: hypothetical protein ACRDGM_10795 [bacterium]